ncbi:MAG TPA: xanthine dehydrogenase family protein molybdopterin-binding subunit [Vicinamibacteria bacterium]|jgi:CO/xanthine dehydrogenase Mo-binding subunit|nr:xanthine dehydrogenase family protein molybdopterin-binding subunit [Vicinamibacteria bacterium]
MSSRPGVGVNALRREGPEKLCGRARYIDDHNFPGCLHGVTLRSSIPHGRIQHISFDPRFPWEECVIATARDVPGGNHVALIEEDQPLLAEGRVRHVMEPILLVAHRFRPRAYEALRHIHVEYEELPPVLTVGDALRAETVLHPPDNVFKSFLIEKGDVTAGLAGADLVVAGEYRVPHQEQAYIENNGMAAYVEEDGTVVVLGSLQCPYYVHKALKHIFDLPDDKVRVVQTTTGGGFGGKEEYPSMIAGHAALLALKARRPVKMIYDRGEDMAATTKRHPAWIKHRTGVMRDGTLVAQDIEVVMDGGAYVTLSPVVLSRGTLHAGGPYACPNVRIRSRVVATTTPPNGAFRGFGAPQVLFAAELQMEKVAEKLGLDPVVLRRRNVFREGSVTATGQVLEESVGASTALERCARKSGYVRRRAAHVRWNRARRPTWRGIGLALCHHGAGFTGSGEAYLNSKAAVSLSRGGEVWVLAASTEIGQGTGTMLAQIVADTLRIPCEWVEVETPDTGKVPNSGPTVASRTCMIVGGLLERAARQLREEVIKRCGSFPRTRAGLRRAGRLLCGKGPPRRFEAEYQNPPEIRWDEAAYRGDAYGVYSYGAVAVDLEVDRLTFEVRVREVTAVSDIGKAINPRLAEGQIMGGTAQALGYALLENVVYENGFMTNSQLTNYIIPTALDTPPLKVEIVEKPYSRGPSGAKGVGELPMDVPAPAVAAAIRQATGHWIDVLPILPERILEAHLHGPVPRQR